MLVDRRTPPPGGGRAVSLVQWVRSTGYMDSVSGGGKDSCA